MYDVHAASRCPIHCCVSAPGDRSPSRACRRCRLSNSVAVLGHLTSGGGASLIAPVRHHLGLQRAAPALHRRGVPAVALTAHRGPPGVRRDRPLVLMAAILRPAVRIRPQPHGRAAPSDGWFKGPHHEVGPQSLAEAAPEDLAREGLSRTFDATLPQACFGYGVSPTRRIRS